METAVELSRYFGIITYKQLKRATNYSLNVFSQHVKIEMMEMMKK